MLFGLHNIWGSEDLLLSYFVSLSLVALVCGPRPKLWLLSGLPALATVDTSFDLISRLIDGLFLLFIIYGVFANFVLWWNNDKFDLKCSSYSFILFDEPPTFFSGLINEL